MNKNYNSINLLIALIVERGWVDSNEVRAAIIEKKDDQFFGEILYDKKLLSSEQLNELLKIHQDSEKRKDDFLFGQIAVHNQIIKAQVIISYLYDKNKSGSSKNLGELLLEKKLITKQQFDSIFAIQKHIQKTVLLKNEKISCPKCQTIFKIKDPERLRKIRCSQCKYIFEVGVQEINISNDPVDENEPISTGLENNQSIEQYLKENQLSPKSNLSDSSQLITKENERYVLGDELARGGMGKILLTKDVNLRRRIVTKILLNRNSKLATLRFIEEAQITGQLEHPNIPPVYDLGINKKRQLFFTMKQIKGETLQDIINKLKEKSSYASEQYSLNSIINVFIKVCNALSFAHSKNVIHRDVKPENIMVGEFGEVLLLDWGLAKIIGTSEEVEELDQDKVSSVRSEDQSSNTMEGTTSGTPAFMSPEQAKGHSDNIDHRADIFSLGATLYNVLELERPIKGKNIQDILNNAADGKINEIKNECPPELKAIVLKAMAYNPVDRYQTIKEMENDLINYQLGYSVSAKQDNSFDIIKKFYIRNKLLTIITSIFLILFLITSILFVISISAQKNEAIEQKEIAKSALQKAEIAIQQFKREKSERIADNKKAAPTYFVKAQVETQNYNTIEAEKLMDTAIDYDPTNQEYLLYRGCLAFANNNIKKSIEDLNKLIDSPHQKIIFKILDILKNLNQSELDEIQKSQLAQLISEIKFYDIAQKLTGDFSKKIELWNKKLVDIWGLGSFTLAMDIDKTKGKGDAKKLIFTMKDRIDNIDLSPLVGIPLQAIKLQNCQLANLNFIENMPLEDLTIINCPMILDILPLKNIKLKSFYLDGSKVKDLTPLAKAPLDILVIKNVDITTLKPLLNIPIIGIEIENVPLNNFNELKSFPVEKLFISKCLILDLEFINLQSLKLLKVNNGRIKDISLLKNTKLLYLDISNTFVNDISVLKNQEIQVLLMENCKLDNLDVILTLKKLDTLVITPNYLPEGWEQIAIQMKSQLKLIGISTKQFLPTSTFIERYKDFNKKKPIPESP